jgi:chromate transporter
MRIKGACIAMTITEFKQLSKKEQSERLKEITLVFLKLGTFSFGGPAAHIAMMDHEIVQKKKWLSREKFVDLLGATNLIPGPNATEMAIHIGMERGSIPGLFLAGIAFIVPAMLICLVIAMAYVRYGSLPDVSFVLHGIKPVIMAVILQALYRLGKSVLKTRTAVFVALLIIALYVAGINEILLLLVAGFLMMLILNQKKLHVRLHSISILPLFVLVGVGGIESILGKISLRNLFFTFLKIGSVLYGSGYVLLAFLETEFVRNSSILTQQQLMDAVAVGQFTPGPVFSTATFIGYLIQGTPGALLATVGIFLPSFFLVWLLNPLIPKMRSSPWVSGLLDGVNIASLGLMAVVSVKLGLSSLTDWLTIVLFASSFFVLMKTKVNSVWLILAGGMIGWVANMLN